MRRTQEWAEAAAGAQQPGLSSWCALVVLCSIHILLI